MDGSEKIPAEAGREQTAYFPLIFALAGFVLAQPVYDLILGAPEFLVARQNTRTELWLLVAVLNGLVPLVLTATGLVLIRIQTAFGRAYFGLLAFLFTATFFAQLGRDVLGDWPLVFFPVVLGLGFLVSRALLFTPGRTLAWTLALLSVSFPVLFLVQIPELEYGEGIAIRETAIGRPGSQLPPVIIVVADELPLSTLLDGDGDIDQVLFPNIFRLQRSANWYRNTISVADGTPEAVPAILTGRYPSTANTPATIANAPVNLFTLLQGQYQLNVAESVTRLCPRSHCPLYSPPGWSRFSALLQDLAALYLHRIIPDVYSYLLPDVSYSWSGFFADKQQFFPGGWLDFAEGQTTVNRPGIFRQFISSIKDSEQPGLYFIHFLYPHVPFAYLPDGRNYGNHWLRGLEKEQWHDTAWGILNSKQRHFLQVQHFDSLVGELIDHLQSRNMFEKSLIVLVADHGAAFRANDQRRALSETNIADILRVPLLVKEPQQATARVFDQPVMTIDILPTVLGILGYEDDKLGFDGMDLHGQLPSPDRQRQALSFKHREYRSFNTAQLETKMITRENRLQLALDEPGKALWGIGPLADYRGLPLERLCTSTPSPVRVVFDQNKPLPGTENEIFIPAFVTGRFTGEVPEDRPYPFVLTVDDIIVASGETWQLRGNRLFFAMVEPRYITDVNWPPDAWLYTTEACLGGPVDG